MEKEYEKIACSFELQIVDSAGKPMHEKVDSIIIWAERYPPVVGDELTLGYKISRRGRNPVPAQITLKVLRRIGWFPVPNDLFHKKAYSLGIWEGGTHTTLVCMPTAKNGGRAGVERLLAHRQELKRRASKRQK